MNAEGPTTRILLLVEDSPGDAQLVAELLDEGTDNRYQIVHATRLVDAVEKLRDTTVDVIVLDLGLPDSQGVDGVRSIRAAAGQTPIVVLTGAEDERIALACIDAGAQDYLSKAEVRAQNLRRAIGYATTRIREAQLRELQQTLERYRALSSAGQRTSVTAALARSGAIAIRDPDVFNDIVGEYYAMVEPGLIDPRGWIAPAREAMEHLITRLGDHAAGPRDLLDVHVMALDRANALHPVTFSRSLLFETRLLALEMMGLLVDYYRVGHRRRFGTGGSP